MKSQLCDTSDLSSCKRYNSNLSAHVNCRNCIFKIVINSVTHPVFSNAEGNATMDNVKLLAKSLGRASTKEIPYLNRIYYYRGKVQKLKTEDYKMKRGKENPQ